MEEYYGQGGGGVLATGAPLQGFPLQGNSSLGFL